MDVLSVRKGVRRQEQKRFQRPRKRSRTIFAAAVDWQIRDWCRDVLRIAEGWHENTFPALKAEMCRWTLPRRYAIFPCIDVESIRSTVLISVDVVSNLRVYCWHFALLSHAKFVERVFHQSCWSESLMSPGNFTSLSELITMYGEPHLRCSERRL